MWKLVKALKMGNSNLKLTAPLHGPNALAYDSDAIAETLANHFESGHDFPIDDDSRITAPSH